MALSSLFPKGFFDSPASSPSPASSSSTPSPELDPMDRLPGRDKDGKLKLPPVAIYVSGAAFALTVALTAMIVPYVKAAGPRTATPPSFISHVNAHRIPRPGRVRQVATVVEGGKGKSAGRSVPPLQAQMPGPGASNTLSQTVNPTSPSSNTNMTTTPTPASASSSSSSPTSSSASSSEPAESKPKYKGTFANLVPSTEIPDALASDTLLFSRRFNTSEERRLYGTSEADGEEAKNASVDPLLGFYALAIATGIVGASTGLGVWVTARMMGVDNMDDFAKKVKEGLAKNMPTLAKVIDEAKEVERKDVGELEGDGVWKHWSETILGEERAKETKL